MVVCAQMRLPELALILAQQAEPVIQRLDPATRAKVLAALAALVILGFALMFFASWAARATRRYMQMGRKPQKTVIDRDDWAKKPLGKDDGA